MSSVLGLIAGIVLSLVPCQSTGVKYLILKDGEQMFYACGSNWSIPNTAVVCHSLGLNYGHFVAIPLHPSDETYISTYNWYCHGWEQELSQCSKVRRQSSCNALVAYNCTVNVTANAPESSLLKSRSLIQSDFDNSSSDHGFILTMKHDNSEWTICSMQDTDDQELVKTLTVACRQLRYKSLSTFEIVSRTDISQYLHQVNPCLPRIWTCLGNENSLAECSNESVPKLSWILYVQCSYSGTPKEGEVRFINNHPYSGYVELFHNSLWGKLCPVYNVSNLQIAVCKQLHLGPSVETYQRSDHKLFGRIHNFILSCQGNESNLAQCQRLKLYEECPSRYTLYATCLSPTLLIRLYPISSNQMTVQVFLMNNWTFIGWDYTWKLAESAVVCGMLHQGPPEYYYSAQIYIDGPHFNFHPNCRGTEKSLLECDLNIDAVSRGATAYVVVIKCAPLNGTKENDIMLIRDSYSTWSNLVFIQKDLQWHIVCGCLDIWSATSAQVICRKMGFSEGYQLTGNADGIMNRYGPPVRLSCSSKDITDISECSITQCDTQTCSQSAKVICSNNHDDPHYAGNIAIPYLCGIPVVILAIIAIVCFYKKLHQARIATNQIVTASITEAVSLQATTLTPIEMDLFPPSYTVFIKNPEMYPLVVDITSSIPDNDLPPYPGMPESSNEVSSV